MHADQHETAPGFTPPSASGWTRLLSLCNNPLSVLGLTIVAFSLASLVAFAVFSLISTRENPYLDIVGFMILPGVLISGLAIVPIGVLWKKRWLRRHQGAPTPRYVTINLDDPPTRGAILIFGAVTFFVVLPALAISGYQGYLYTESTEFCARACHSVMDPQGTAHQSSPHARVSCAECHIGEGAGWFVQSKLSGVRQVFAVWLDTFSRPIPPAIQELRPARDTCEHCHWPAMFHGSTLRQTTHYSPDENNTPHIVRMLLKTGGADESIGRVEGIHMHMIASGKIEYVAVDEHLQDIPWVRYVQADGTATVYRSDGKPHDAPPPDGVRRTVDCMDCHNRGAHHFRPPDRAVDLKLVAGEIDATLPYIKRQAVQALIEPHASVAAAEQRIAESIAAFYEQERPQDWRDRQADIRQAIAAVQDIYRRNFFPGMNVDWRTYPENVGHMLSAGCFRCHDGLHLDPQGKPISSECTTCHTFLNERPEQPGQFTEGPFQHSMPILHHENLRCSQCHTGGPLRLCRDCHAEMRGLENWNDIGRFRPVGP